MSKGKGAWQDGRRAWERLKGWHQDAPPLAPSAPRRPDDGEDALAALADVGLVRRLLDQAELVAVRTARRHGKSWAEIATRLGVTRQSAWERWRDLDEVAPPAAAAAGTRETVLGVEAAAAVERARPPEAGTDAAAETLEWAMRSRRRSTVVVPNVTGMPWDDARHALQNVSLVAVGPDPDGPPLAATGWPDGVVSDQSPEAGAKVAAGSTVALWIDEGGGSAVREPRRPKPTPRTARGMRDEISDEAVG